MPTFPTYDRELPQCLNPLNPRHYLLVLYWVFFRPTTLKCYLYQASSEINKHYPGWRKPREMLKCDAHRNFIFISLVLAFGIVFLYSHILMAPVLLKFCSSSNSGVNHDVFFAGYIDKICLSISRKPRLQNWLSITRWLEQHFPYVIPLVSGVASGFLFNSQIKITMYIAQKIFRRGIFNEEILLINIMFAIMIVLLLTYFFDSISKEVFFKALLFGLFWLPFYFLELANSLVRKHTHVTHPILWDEFCIFPLPKATRYLANQLCHSPGKGLTFLAQIVVNPFQAWVVHNASWLHLGTSPSPIEQIYYWATTEELDRYAHLPANNYQWETNISSRQMLFAEMAGVSLHADGRVLFGMSNFSRLLTNPFRCKPITPLQNLIILFLAAQMPEVRLFPERYPSISAGLLLPKVFPNTRIAIQAQLYFGKMWEKLRLASDAQFDLQIDNYVYGSEVQNSFVAISAYLKFPTPQQLTTAPTQLTWLNPTDTFLRPTVIQALQTLSTISQEVHRANIASSKINQRNAILLANDNLEHLIAYVTENVHPNYPEQKLLLRIIDQWQTIITKAGGELGRDTLTKPIENPYVVGPPVTGSLFVGREDILKTLEELWTKPGQLESVVIYGHRRMGKTSILRNLPDRFGPITRIINFNIQTLGTLRTTSELILALTQTLYDELPTHIQTHIPEPQLTDFPTPEKDFRRWLKKLEQYRQEDRFIIAIDEFELIETGIQQGRFDPSIIGHWRGILNDFPWIIFAFAGLHTLQEMTQDYWNPLFGSVRKIPVTFLSPTAAHQLITNPTDDFPIDYTPEAVNLIYNLTGGQPYLIQLICQNLISRFNKIRFEQNQEIEPLFTEADVQAIVTDPNFFRDGTAYFRAIWEQAQETEAAAQLAILQQLTIAPATESELLTTTNLNPETFTIARDLLRQHDIIQLNPQNQYQYRVELMRQWVTLKIEHGDI